MMKGVNNNLNNLTADIKELRGDVDALKDVKKQVKQVEASGRPE